jgi:hypothetical protein
VILIGPYLAACALLVAAGCAKAVRPDDTARALAPLLGLRPIAACRAVRLAAGAEALVGAWALVMPRPVPAAIVALSYAGFAGFVTYARHRGGALATCGCFATPDTPATRLHVVVDLALAGAALAVAVGTATRGAPRSIAAVLARQPWHGVPLVLVSALCAWLVFHALSTLPKAQAARRLVAGSRE